MTNTASRDIAVRRRAVRPASEGRHDLASWRDEAACRDAETDLFFPIGSTGPAVGQIEQARAVCARCPVRQPCLAYALTTHQQYGIWGGCDEDERRHLRQRQVTGPATGGAPARASR